MSREPVSVEYVIVYEVSAMSEPGGIYDRSALYGDWPEASQQIYEAVAGGLQVVVEQRQIPRADWDRLPEDVDGFNPLLEDRPSGEEESREEADGEEEDGDA